VSSNTTSGFSKLALGFALPAALGVKLPLCVEVEKTFSGDYVLYFIMKQLPAIAAIDLLEDEDCLALL
jgi:hypothetical protein